MGRQEKNPEVKVAEAPKAAPSPEVDKNPGVKARGVEADKAAQAAVSPDATKPPEVPFENPENLPDNEWSRQYYDLQKQAKENPNMQGPLMGFALAALKLAAKYAKYTDMMPGAFSSRVAKSEELKDVKLDPKRAAELVDAHVNKKGKTEEDAKKELAALKEKEKTGGPKLGIERAATKFVANVLWDIDDFTDTGTLAANLLHTTKGGQALYKEMDREKEDITKLAPSDVQRGTLIIFIPKFENGEKVVAYATGVEDEFKYYDLETPSDPIKTFKLRDNDSPLKSLKTTVQMIMIPNVKAYRDAKEEAPAEDIEVKTQKALEKIEKDNLDGERMIKEYPNNPSPANLSQLKTTAATNFSEASKMYTEMDAKSKSDELNIEKLTAAEAVAKTKAEATGATDEDKNLYTEAVKKLEVAKKFKENSAKLKLLRDQAEKNNNDAQKLK